MKGKVVEVVFAIDSSGSMESCFIGLADNIEGFLRPLREMNFDIRLGLVTLGVHSADDQRSFGIGQHEVRTLAGLLNGSSVDPIYSTGLQPKNTRLFTDSVDEFLACLREVGTLDLGGDENSLLLLDLALDFPFLPTGQSRRVVALFADEPVEGGAVRPSDYDLVPRLLRKIGDRRVMLFMAMPGSECLEALGSADCCQVEVLEDDDDGFESLDFQKLLGQMAKSISISSLQGEERPYERALFGQDRW